MLDGHSDNETFTCCLAHWPAINITSEMSNRLNHSGMLAAMQNANKDRWILLDIQPATDPKHGRIVLEIQNGDLPNWNASLFVLCRAFRALSLMAFTCAAAEIGCVFQSVSNLKKCNILFVSFTIKLQQTELVQISTKFFGMCGPRKLRPAPRDYQVKQQSNKETTRKRETLKAEAVQLFLCQRLPCTVYQAASPRKV